ncbi:hypothetical protein [Maritimibacter sp. DP1N21-5]|uniref:hypothetical protein n=1 Tax=Maritimibacter sp. DP1N21-5 TaxID=2836867 RepID=UPI001C45B1BF|nr:hypothetical protein [Maritimibacter sp. DP1N21-5]MBV7409782.1 hypothetical protein [Maritimibacter sp. DP1N21-5]
MNEDGGTDHVVWRKDRVRCLRGAEHLAEYRLSRQSATRRIIATCCGTPMFLDYTKGGWATIYRDRLPPEERPKTEMRVMLRDRVGGDRLPDDCKNLPRYSLGLFARLLTSWSFMGFSRRGIDFVHREL